jgi:hypothetical protein
MRARWIPVARIAQILAVLIAGVTAGFSADTAAVRFCHAESESGATLDFAIATEALLTTTALGFPPDRPVRITSRLTVPIRARWSTCLAEGSLVLTMASGALQVAVTDGVARVAPRLGFELGVLPLRELVAGESMVLDPGNRLVMHGHGSLVAQNVGQGAAVAAVIRVS